MRAKRYAGVLLAGILMALGVAAAPAPASAAGVTCTHWIEWYRSTYEVTAAEVWNCNQAAYQITAAVEITKPRRSGNANTCLAEWSCRAVTTAYNASGTQQYCATGGGSYWYGSGPFQKHTPRFVSSCIDA